VYQTLGMRSMSEVRDKKQPKKGERTESCFDLWTLLLSSEGIDILPALDQGAAQAGIPRRSRSLIVVVWK